MTNQPTHPNIEKGKTVGEFTFLEEIGRGNFATVYSARSQGGINVAIKCTLLSRHNEHNGLVGKLFQNEVKAMEIVQNEHVVSLCKYMVTKNNSYIVMEYCDGGTLQQLSNKQPKRRFPERQALNYFKQILKGMKGLHEKFIIHRDLKQANILIHQQKLKISDLGFCDFLNYEEQQMDLNLGSLGTKAPEITEGKRYGLQADLFSVGVILYELIFGQLPFKFGSAEQFLNDVRRNKPNLTLHDIQLTPDLQDILSRMLKSDPNERIKWSELYSHKLFNQQGDQIFESKQLQDYIAQDFNAMESAQIYTELEFECSKQLDPNQLIIKQHQTLQVYQYQHGLIEVQQQLNEQQGNAQKPPQIKQEIKRPDDQALNSHRQQDQQADQKNNVLSLENGIDEFNQDVLRSREIIAIVNQSMASTEPYRFQLHVLQKIRLVIQHKVHTIFPSLMLIKFIVQQQSELCRKVKEQQSVIRANSIHVIKMKYFDQFEIELQQEQKMLHQQLEDQLKCARINIFKIELYLNEGWQREIRATIGENFTEVYRDSLQALIEHIKVNEITNISSICLQIHLWHCIHLKLDSNYKVQLYEQMNLLPLKNIESLKDMLLKVQL